MSETTSFIHYAVEIYSENSDSWYSTTNKTYGLKNGVFRFITGRPGYDGSGGPTYGHNEIGFYGNDEGDQPNNYEYFEGFITEEGMIGPSKSIDIISTGSYSTDGTSSFSIRNNNKFWNYCSGAGIEFTGRRVLTWVVINGVFYQTSRGRISNNPYDEKNYTFVVSDESAMLHKQLPPVTITNTAYANSPDSSNGEVVPVVFGDVPYSKVFKEDETDTRVQLTTNSYACCAASYYPPDDGSTSNYSSPYGNTNPARLYLYTYGKTFSDHELQGLYVSVIYGSQAGKYSYRIKDSYATVSHITRIDLYDLLLDSTDDIVSIGNFNSLWVNETTGIVYRYSYYIDPGHPPTNGYPFCDFSKVWLFQVSNFNIGTKISNQDVTPLLNENGKYACYTYNSDTSNYEDISNYLDIDSTSDSIKVLSNTLTNDKKIDIYRDLGMELYQFGFLNVALPFPSVNTGDEHGYITNNATALSVATDHSRLTSWTFPVTFYSDKKYTFMARYYLKKLSQVPSKVKFLVDLDITNEYEDSFVIGNFRTAAWDIYGNQLFYGVSNISPSTHLTATTYTFETESFNLIPNSYYASSKIVGDDLNYYSYSSGHDVDKGYEYLAYRTVNQYADLSAQVSPASKDNISNDLIYRLSCYLDFVCASSDHANGLVVKVKQIALVGVDSEDTIQDDIYVKVEGETINEDSTDEGAETDNVYDSFIHILEDYDGIPKIWIDYGDLSTKRDTWHVGRTIDDRRNSVNYLNELCCQSFVGMFTTRQGKRGLRCIQDFTSDTAIANHDSSIIIRDSIKSFERTDASKVYNNFVLQYNYDQGSKKFNRSFFVNGVDEYSTFPYEATLDDDGNPLWWKLFGGLTSSTTNYNTAKTIWDRCRASFVKNMTLKQASNDVSQLYWYTDRYIFDSATTWGTGSTSSAFYFLSLLSQWSTLQKYVISYSVPITADTIELDLLDVVSVTDSFYTNNTALIGRIVDIGIDSEKDSIDLSVLLYPDTLQPTS